MSRILFFLNRDALKIGIGISRMIFLLALILVLKTYFLLPFRGMGNGSLVVELPASRSVGPGAGESSSTKV
jgi:hypothetical protein